MSSRRKVNRKKKVRRQRRGSIISVAQSTHIPRNVGGTGSWPSEMMLNLVSTLTFNPAGAVPFSVIDFRLNSIWQPFVGGATGTASGYAGASNIYSNYHVERVTISFTVAANETANSCSFGFVLNDTQPSTLINTYAKAFTALGSRMCFLRSTIGDTAGTSLFRSRSKAINAGDIVGNPLAYFGGLDFSGSMGANPNQAVWGSFVLMSESASLNITAGVITTIRICQRTRLYGVLPLS